MLCKNCKKKQSCKELCPAVNKYLKDNGIKSADWIRARISSTKRGEGQGKWREIPFSSFSSENTDKNPYFGPNIQRDNLLDNLLTIKKRRLYE